MHLHIHQFITKATKISFIQAQSIQQTQKSVLFCYLILHETLVQHHVHHPNPNFLLKGLIKNTIPLTHTNTTTRATNLKKKKHFSFYIYVPIVSSKKRVTTDCACAILMIAVNYDVFWLSCEYDWCLACIWGRP